MKVCDIINVIEKTAPLGLAASWDKSGLQVAAFRQEAFHLAVMLDPLLPNIVRARELGADFLLSHHPLSLEPRYPDSTGDYHSILSALFKADIPLYSAHTSLDANPLGPVRWLGQKLDLRRLAVLEAEGRAVLPGQSEAQDYGFGFVGDLPAPLDYAAFGKKLAACTELRAWRSCGPRPETVRRVACCPGSGGGMIGPAKAAGADLLVTGDLRYHSALEAELHVIDLGHFQLEEIMMREFAVQLGPQLPGLQISFIAGSDPLSFDIA